MKIIDNRELYEVKKDDFIVIIVLALSLKEALKCVFDSHLSEESEDHTISARKIPTMECNTLKFLDGSSFIDHIREDVNPGKDNSIIISHWEDNEIYHNED